MRTWEDDNIDYKLGAGIPLEPAEREHLAQRQRHAAAPAEPARVTTQRATGNRTTAAARAWQQVRTITGILEQGDSGAEQSGHMRYLLGRALVNNLDIVTGAGARAQNDEESGILRRAARYAAKWQTAHRARRGWSL